MSATDATAVLKGVPPCPRVAVLGKFWSLGRKLGCPVLGIQATRDTDLVLGTAFVCFAAPAWRMTVPSEIFLRVYALKMKTAEKVM